MAGLIGGMFERFEARQALFFNYLPGDARQKLAEAENRYAELRVTGPEGGVFYFRFRGQRLQKLSERPDVPDEKMDKVLIDGDGINYHGGDDVLVDVINGSLSPRAAKSHGLFWTNTDRSIYDSEEFIQAFENFIDEMRMVLGGKSS
ncbi:hypothetical protein ES703_79895 [subsurface metagenome]